MSKVHEISYSELTGRYPFLKNVSLNFSQDWSEIDSGNKYYGIFNDADLAGAFTLYESKRSGLNHISNPPFFQNIGLWIADAGKNTYYQQTFIKQQLQAICDFLSEKKWVNICLPVSLDDVQPFFWDKYECRVRYTYLQRREDFTSLQNASKGFKSAVKSLKNKELRVNSSKTAENRNLLLAEVSKTRNGKDFNYFQKLLDKLMQWDGFKICTVESEGGKAVAAGTCSGKTFTYILGGGDKVRGIPLGTAALVNLIQSLDEKVVNIDFEGSMLPGVEKYFRSAGGVLTPFYHLSKVPKVIKAKEIIS